LPRVGHVLDGEDRDPAIKELKRYYFPKEFAERKGLAIPPSEQLRGPIRKPSVGFDVQGAAVASDRKESDALVANSQPSSRTLPSPKPRGTSSEAGEVLVELMGRHSRTVIEDVEHRKIGAQDNVDPLRVRVVRV
jgi:hypothetical protein